MGEGFALRGYVVERPLGRGASGEVWRARAAASGAPVALKRILTADDGERERAGAEAALLRTLDHPNLIRLHAVVPTADAVVLVLDLADGGSLAGLLEARGRLAPGEVITAIAPVAAALAYLHEAGVVHGDVSPGNVLFTAAGMPLLADVGVARLIGADDAVRATPAYVDPTVAAGHLPGPPSDVFMLAGVALHALTGEPPWPGDPEAALAAAARSVAMDADGRAVAADARARLAAAGVGAAMAEVLTRALDHDPARRGAAADLALELQHSGRPVAIELGAGAAREPVAWRGPRHAARSVGGDSGAAGGAVVTDGSGGGGPAAPAGDGARPSFARPHEVAEAEPPTRMVGPRPRPVIPRPPARRSRRRLLLAAGAAGVVVLAAGGIGWAATRPDDGSGGEQPRAHVETVGVRSALAARSEGPSSVRPSSAGSSSAGSSSASSSPAGPNSWVAALDRVDAQRAQAFLTRDDAALRSVYASPALAATDVGQLHRLVPTGCGLRGVRTTYRALRVAVGRDRATFVVSAVLDASQLVCGGQVRATLPGAGPTRLRIVLVGPPARPRIVRQEVVA